MHHKSRWIYFLPRGSLELHHRQIFLWSNFFFQWFRGTLHWHVGCRQTCFGFFGEAEEEWQPVIHGVIDQICKRMHVRHHVTENYISVRQSCRLECVFAAVMRFCMLNKIQQGFWFISVIDK